MKLNKTLIGVWLVVGILVTVCCAAPEFSGVLKSGGKTYLALRPEATAAIGWYQVGEAFGNYLVVSYDDARDTVVLSQAGARVEVRLNGARVESTPTISLMEQLARGGDQAMQKMLSEAKTLNERRTETASEVARVESLAKGDRKAAEPLPELRRKLKIEEDNLAYFLQNLVMLQPKAARP